MSDRVEAKFLGCSCLGRLIAMGLILAALVVGIMSGQRLSAWAQENIPMVGSLIPVGSSIPTQETAIGVARLADKGRVNILLIGLDQRDEEAGPWHADGLVLVTVDPQGGSGGALVIPGDLWVPIPGFGEDRIGSAYFYGSAAGDAEEGARLAVETVERSLGVRIHHHVCFNFLAFRAIVDSIGGITVDVDEPIWDDRYPDGKGGTMTIAFDQGLQFMDGETALRYVRTRHGGDLGRVRRQQKVLWAIYDKIRSLDILPRVPHLVQALGENLRTDIDVGEMVALVQFGLGLEPGSIVLRGVDASMVSVQATTSGSSVLVPDWEAIRRAVESLSTPPAPSDREAPATMSTQPSIEVLNGTSTAGLAQRTSRFLEDRGYRVILYANADRFDYQETLIVDLTGDEGTALELARLLGVSPERVCHQLADDSPVDIRIILGEDFVLPQ